MICTAEDEYTRRFLQNFNQIYSLGQNVAKATLPYFEQISTYVNLTKQCHRTLSVMFSHPELEWSALMFDASGRLIRPGFLSGTITDYGDYDQCLSINHPEDPRTITTADDRIQGRYCLMTIRLPIPPVDRKLNFTRTSYENRWPSKWFNDPRYWFYYRIVSAVCFPSQCQAEEIESLARKVFESFDLTIQVEACQTKFEQESQPLDFAQKFSILILAICLFSVLLGTFVDWRNRCQFRNEQKLFQQENNILETNFSVEFCNSFSLMRNTEALFTINDTQITSSSNAVGGQMELTPIHGLRYLMIMWVIICHTTNFAPLGLYDQPMIAARFAERIQIVREFWTQFVISGSLSVQTFFLISGLISLHTALKNRSIFLHSVPYWKYVLLRWLRFAPPLLGMFCYQFLWPLLGSGPMMHWNYLRYGHQPCYDRWWANFLFISNWFKLTDQCGSHTWFLSADFQINLLAYFLIWLYVYQYKFGFWVNLISLMIASVSPTIINWYYGVPLVHILEPDVEKLNLAFNMIEFNTYNHYAAYLAGFLVAGLLHNRFCVDKNLRTILWWIAMILVLIIPFSTYPFIQLDQIPSTFLPMIYTGVKRTLWIGAIGWIIYASCTGSRNCIVARFLSARIFQPFSRLTFCIYLTQSLVVWYYAYNSRELHTISHYNSIFRIGGVTLYSLAFAYILYILFEAPSVNICRMVFKRHQRMASKQATFTSTRSFNKDRELADINTNSIHVEEKSELIDENNRPLEARIIKTTAKPLSTTKQCIYGGSKTKTLEKE